MTLPGRDRRNIVVDVTVTSDTRGVNAAVKGLGDVDGRVIGIRTVS